MAMLIHSILRKKYTWYEKWHNHPHHQHTHWLIFASIILVAATLVSSQIFLTYFVDSPAEAQTTLPAPSHSIMLGYYHVVAQYGDYLDDVSNYTNTQIILENSFLRSDGTNNITDFNNAFSRSIAARDDIVFAVDFTPSLIDRGLTAAAPYWNSIDMIYLADEPTWDKATTEANITSFKNAVSQKGLAQKPIAINFTHNQIMTGTGFQASNLDIVGFEAYVDPSQQNSSSLVSDLNAQIDQAKSKIGNRQMFIVIQGYDRNGAWTNMPSLQSIQTPPYLKAYNDSRVIGLFIFTYARPGGSKDLGDCIKNEHRKIWGAISGTAQPASASCSTSGVLQFAPILSTWNPGQADGWWPELSPDGRYVTFGNARTYIANLETKVKLDITPSTETRCWGGFWIKPNTLTFVCEIAGGGGMHRYEASLSDNWKPSLTSDDPKLVNASNFYAKDGHWATYLAGNPLRIAKDNALLTNTTGGLGGLNGELLNSACDNSNTSICLWNGFTKTNTYATKFGFNDLRLGGGDYMAYGNRIQVRGICISDQKDINLKASYTNYNEGLTGWSSIFMVDGKPWVITASWSGADTFVLLRPWGEKGSIIVNLPAVYTSVYYDSQARTFEIAYNNDRGGMAVVKVSRDAPLSYLSGLAPETCGSVAQLPTPTPSPSLLTQCSDSTINSGVVAVCDFGPNLVQPGDTVKVIGVMLGSTIELYDPNGIKWTITGTVNSDQSEVDFIIPNIPENEYTLKILSSNGSSYATTNKILTVTLTPPGSGNGEPPPFAQSIVDNTAYATAATDFGQLISNAFRYAVILVGIAVFIMLLWAGFLWLTSAANPSNIARAKSMIFNAIIGAILLLSAYVILYTINPELVGGTFNLDALPSLPTSGNSQAAPAKLLAFDEASAGGAITSGCTVSNDSKDFTAVECPSTLSVPAGLVPNPVLSAVDVSANDQVQATTLQNNGNTGTGRKVVILDTGINYNHQDLKSSYLGGWDFINNDNDPMDDDTNASDPAHGSHVAGIITADGIDARAKGVAPGVGIISGKVLDSNGTGDWDKIISAIYWAVNGPDGIYGTADDFKADAINISIGGGTYSSLCDNYSDVTRKFAKALKYAKDNGVLPVIAAGNVSSGVSFPGCLKDALTVGAVDGSDRIANFSGRGEGVDLVAPGVDIYSTLFDNNYGTKRGTSMATPIVSGLAALIKAANPTYSAYDVEQTLESTACDLGSTGKDTTFGWGRVNAVPGGCATSSGAVSNGSLVLNPASCTKGAISSNPNCNTVIKYEVSGISNQSITIKKGSSVFQTITCNSSCNGQFNDNNPSIGTHNYTLNLSNGSVIADVNSYIYAQGSIVTDIGSCTKSSSGTNPNCDIKVTINARGIAPSGAIVTKDGFSWKILGCSSDPCTNTVTDTSPATGIHTYALFDQANNRLSRTTVLIYPASGTGTCTVQPGATMELCTGTNFTGTCQTFNCTGINNFTGTTMAGQTISSARVTGVTRAKVYTCDTGWIHPNPSSTEPTACLWKYVYSTAPVTNIWAPANDWCYWTWVNGVNTIFCGQATPNGAGLNIKSYGGLYPGSF